MNHTHPLQIDFGRAFALGILLNTGFVAVEVIFGLLSHSLTLLADAGHNLSDVMGLLIAWGATSLERRGPTKRFTYGFRRTSVLAALANAILLLVSVGAIALEAIRRLREPTAVAGRTIIWVAAVGVIINGITAWMFIGGRKRDLNIRAAFLHMAADAAVSAGVVLAGFIILRTGWTLLDPISSLVTIGNGIEIKAMLVRLIDVLKTNKINALFTSLVHLGSGDYNDDTIDAVSSLADNWINLKNDTANGKRTRKLMIVKSRGMGHFNDSATFTIGDKGLNFDTANN